MIWLIAPMLVVAIAAGPVRDSAVDSLNSLLREHPEIAVGEPYRAILESLDKGDRSASASPETADLYYRLAAMQVEFLKSVSVQDKEEALPSPPQPPPPKESAQGAVPPPQGVIVRAETVHTVARGETIRKIAARYDIDADTLAAKNGLTTSAPLSEGQRLRVSARRIAPQPPRDGIVINIPERTLYYYRNGALSLTTPVSVGKPKNSRGEGWETPTGEFRILGRVKDPVWSIPKSIREEMAQEGKEPVLQVPPGPANPLGKHALKTSIRSILIHGTNAPNSIYRFSSHGCIRVPPKEMETLFRIVPNDTAGRIVYEPVKIASTEEGKVFVEIHRDVYGKIPDIEADVRRRISSLRLDELVDWQKIRKVIRKKSGAVEDITRDEASPPPTRLSRRD